jgi:DNA-binding Lrp family transcriptional regulator
MFMTNFLYNPDRKSKEQLIAEFVVRTDVLNEIMHDLETSDMKTPEQHYLLVGQRGSGKTTLLNRIKYAVEDSEKLKDWLIPVIFSEEQYNITELANLWENVGQVLEDYHGFEGLTKEMDKHAHGDHFEERAYEILELEMRKKSKKLMLLIDNIGDFLKKLGDPEIRRLREILQTKSDIRITAGSSFYLESILDYKQPLFEFFKVIRLDGLSAVETQDLLKKLGQIYNEAPKIDKLIQEKPERIDTLRVLTGGVPRTIALMFKVFIDYDHGSSLRDLERILDAVTPLYKHRMDDLSTQQQKIVDAVAKNWDRISVKQLTSRVRLESKALSAQLRQLEKNQIIEKFETETKNHLYQLKERFFNIWYLMRYGRKYDKMRVIWLVKFLENWCDSLEIESRILDYVKKINEGELDEASITFYGQIYTAFDKLNPKIRFLLKTSTPADISAEVALSNNEVTRIFLEHVQSKAWANAVEVASHLNSVDNNIKLLISRAVFELNFIKFETKAFQNIKNKISSGLKNGNFLIVGMTAGEWAILLSSLFASVAINIFTHDFEQLPLSLNHYLTTCEALKDHLSDVDYRSLNEIIILLLAAKHHHLADLVFNTDFLELKDRLKPTYYCLLYLRHGIKPTPGSELDEPVTRIMDQVNKLTESVYGAWTINK